MTIILIALITIVLLLSFYHVGRIVKYSRGEQSTALPTHPNQTLLDRIMSPKLQLHPNESCLMLLHNNLDAFAIRAITAYEAGRSLDLQYYIWHDDLTGRLLASEILTAADRGVRVRLLLDDINVRDDSLILRGFNAHPNISVRLFNPVSSRRSRFMRGLEMALRVYSINRRMHNKAWIVDGRIAIVGGRNIGDEYFDAAPKRNFFDADLLVGGKAVSDAEHIFDHFWNSRFAIPLEVFFTETIETLIESAEQMNALKTSDAAKPYLQKLLKTSSVNALFDGNWPIHWTQKAYVLSDPPEKILKKRQDEWVFSKIQSIFSDAKEKLNIVSPYFVPGKVGMNQFIDVSQKHVEINILTNSLAATDVFLVHGGYQHYRKWLLKMGVHLYELKPFGKTERSLLGSKGASLHTKACLVDDRIGFIGSFNFDQRSALLNTEMGVLFEESTITRALQKAFVIHSSFHYSYKLLLVDNKIRWQDTTDDDIPCLWTHEPHTKWWQRCMAKIISFLPLDSQL